jgi:hypothetical protein
MANTTTTMMTIQSQVGMWLPFGEGVPDSRTGRPRSQPSGTECADASPLLAVAARLAMAVALHVADLEVDVAGAAGIEIF